MKDEIQLDGSLAVEVSSPLPKYPCHVCGHETVQHDAEDVERRICTNVDCETVQTVHGAGDSHEPR